MGKLLRIVAAGLVFSLFRSGVSQAAGNVAGNFDWALEKIQREDIKVRLVQGQLHGFVKIGVRIFNRNPVSVTLQGYRASISQQGQTLASVVTSNAQIELPANEVRTISAEFEISGKDFAERIEQLLNGGELLAPIDIAGELTLGNGIVLPIDQSLEFFALT